MDKNVFQRLAKKMRAVVPELKLSRAKAVSTPSDTLIEPPPELFVDQAVNIGNDGNEMQRENDMRCRPTNVSIPVESVAEWVEGLLHLPPEKASSSTSGLGRVAVIMFAGIYGGFDGPSGIYEEVGLRLANNSPGIPVLRLDYRYPSILPDCIEDVRSSMTYLEGKYAISKFVLVGWSFGGAVAYTTTALDKGMTVFPVSVNAEKPS